MPTPAGRLPLPPGEHDPLEADLGLSSIYLEADQKKKKDRKERGGKTEKRERKHKKETKGAHRRTSPNVVKLPPARTHVRRAPASAEGANVLNAIMQGTNPATNKANQGKNRKPATSSIWLRLAKLTGGTIFAVGYVGLVIFLFIEVSKTNDDASSGEHSDACAALQCPSDSICVDRSGRGHVQCSQNSYQNAQLLQIVLGLVVGIPAVICLPCSAQWLFRTGGPAFCTWYSETRRRHRVEASKKGLRKSASAEMLTTSSPRLRSSASQDLEPGEVEEDAQGQATQRKRGFFGKLWTRLGFRRGADSSESLSSKQITEREKKFADMDTELGEVGDADDDILDHIFANPKRKDQPAVKDDEDDFLDSIFASRKEVPNRPPPLPPPHAPLEPPDEDLADTAPLSAIFAKNTQKNRVRSTPADDESFGDLFHTPNRPKTVGRNKRKEGPLPAMPTSAPQRQRAGGDEEERSRTEFSAGLSAIFAGTSKKTPGSKISDAGSKFSKPPDSTASSQQDDFYEEEEEVESYGEAPDFIEFALGIARSAGGAGDDGKSSIAGSDIFGKSRDRDSDVRSNATVSSDVDSLADMEPSDLSELFHPPL